MAGVKPFFLTGANAKIKVNDKTLAYCTNISYSVKVNHATPQVLGMYEASSVEPLSYLVTGQFSVIRYVADAVSQTRGQKPHGVQNSGNGIGHWGQDTDLSSLKKSLANLKDGRAYQNLVPKELQYATTFDIEIIQKTSGSENVTAAKIRNVRITQADFALSKKAPATQTFNFTAIYADEDSFLADFSGLGQQFS